MGISHNGSTYTFINYLNTNIKIMLKLKYFLLVTLYFQLLNVESAPLGPIIGSAFPSSFLLADTGVGVGNLNVNLASSGCWPKTIHDQQVLAESKLSKTQAERKAQQAIAEDPENTICERAWWIFRGWTVTCSRAPYQGLDCGSGTHIVEWSIDKYRWSAELVNELETHS